MKRNTGIGIGLIIVFITAFFGWALLSASGGRPVAPLDDTYIHFQYARQIARGHPWQYNDGDALSTGATSPLYPFLLAIGYRVGFDGERLVWLALGLGVVSLGLSAWLLYRITERLIKAHRLRSPVWTHWAPLGAAILFLLTGAVQWTYLSGMESGLFTVVVLAALDAFSAKSGRRSIPILRRPSFWIALAALTRPEGLVLAGVLCCVTIGQSWKSHPLRLGQDRDVSFPLRSRSGLKVMSQRVWKDAGWATVAVLAGVLPFLLNLILTGSPVATGAQAKSWLGNVPFRFWDILHSILGNYGRILEQFAAGLLARKPWLLVPGMLVSAAAGWIALLSRRRWGLTTLIAGWFVLGTLATAALITATWHVGRYHVPFLAILIPLTMLGLAALIDKLPDRWHRPVAVCLALVTLGTAVTSTLQARSLYRRAVYTVTHQQLAVADWLRHNLPPDARVGVHDTGAIRYVGQRATYDMIGLTTQGAATAWRHGAGAVFERMEHSAARPSHFATYPDVFSLPYLVGTDLFATELFRAEVPDFAVASAGPVQAVFQADWHLADSGDRMYQSDMLRLTEGGGLRLTDHLDLADLDDEAAHALTFWEDSARPGFPTEVQQYRYRTDPTVEVLDGGRLVNGGLSFRVAAQPGQPALLIARLHAAQAGAVRVIVDGHDIGLWRYPALPGEWLESAISVPVQAITQDIVEIRLEVDTTNTAFRHFGLYYLWVWQGQPALLVPKPGHPLTARLGDSTEFMGFDLSLDDPARDPSQPCRPGETIRLVLYWRALAEPMKDAKAFVHLYDQRGKIVAQQDHRPYYGTRPPYTWSLGETLDDPYTLELPADLPPGHYTLATGMYNPVTGVRLPVAVAAEHALSDNRILLYTIDVKTGTES